MRLLVCGGRDFGTDSEEHDYIFWKLHEVIQNEGLSFADVTIVQGGARGADSAAADFARMFYLPLEEFPADWDKHGKAAGAIRNQQMIDEGRPDLVVAFPGGRGTDDMCKRAVKAGIEIRRFTPNWD